MVIHRCRYRLNKKNDLSSGNFPTTAFPKGTGTISHIDSLKARFAFPVRIVKVFFIRPYLLLLIFDFFVNEITRAGMPITVLPF